MYCDNCGARIDAESVKCKVCGTDLSPSPVTGELSHGMQQTAASLAVIEHNNRNVNASRSHKNSTRVRNTRKALMWSGIGVLAILIGVGGYFGTSIYVSNHDAKDALAAAESGNFAAAVSNQQHAIRWNPRNSSLPGDLASYTTALHAKNEITSANHLTQEQKYSQAITDYSSAQTLLSNSKNVLFNSLMTDIQTGTERATIGQVEQASASSSNATTVADDYVQLSKYTDNSGKTAQTTIENHLNSLVTKDVQQQIKTDNFSDASQEIQTISQSVPNDSGLTNLSQQVKAAQSAFEQRQQQIEEQSMAQAASIANLNANPIEVVNVSMSTDSLGDTVATGTVQNQGTNIVGNIDLTVEFYDSSQNLVDTEYVGVSPDPLNPGEQATFSISIPDFYNATTASVTYATWLNE